jgi:hypothetical protein
VLPLPHFISEVIAAGGLIDYCRKQRSKTQCQG